MILELALAAATAQTASKSADCAVMKNFKLPGVTLEITRSEWQPAGTEPPRANPNAPPAPYKLPAYCRVDGMIDRRT
ncbi:MAG TPA: hypothetical protein VN628_20135, partial [Vicinamibacterales bacterium]|nr:hypothetical protein [Vicinamibacterales bacterium]